MLAHCKVSWQVQSNRTYDRNEKSKRTRGKEIFSPNEICCSSPVRGPLSVVRENLNPPLTRRGMSQRFQPPPVPVLPVANKLLRHFRDRGYRDCHDNHANVVRWRTSPQKSSVGFEKSKGNKIVFQTPFKTLELHKAESIMRRMSESSFGRHRHSRNGDSTREKQQRQPPHKQKSTPTYKAKNNNGSLIDWLTGVV